MAISGFKMVLILAVVCILFLPTFIKRASIIPGMLAELRGRFSGEEGGRPASAAAAPPPEVEVLPPGRAERFGNAMARLGQRLKGRRHA